MAKGPLTTGNTNSTDLSFPGHLMIIPINHCPTFEHLGDKKEETLNEMNDIREKIERAYEQKGTIAVTYCINKLPGVHAHWQIIPIPKQKIDQLEPALNNAIQNIGLELNSGWPTDERHDYFAIRWTGSEAKTATIPSSVRFNPNFARQFLAKLLNIPERENWRQCTQTQDDEIRDGELTRSQLHLNL